MRLSPICIAITLTLIAGCQTSRPEQPAAAAVADAVAGRQAQAAQRVRAAKSVGSVPLLAPGTVAMEADAGLAYAPPPAPQALARAMHAPALAPIANTERYEARHDNPVHLASQEPVSTFSIDVDTGSYSNVRRMLMAGQRPPADAVRAEEMLNYFDYGYPAPTSREVPFQVSTEMAPAPWNARRQLVQIGIQGYRVATSEIPAANLVFLIDTSGSMQDEDKLPLLKRSFAELARQLRPQDRVSIVVYAGSAGVVLAPTPGDRQDLILGALDRLSAGGSTNGGQGLELAYAMARSAFLARGVNRVILATDGDFNVGTVDQKALETMVADQRKTGIALTTLGFGTGNYNDAMAEQLADLGNGNHAYVDSIDEGRKVLVEELSSTMLTIAEDVNIQVEFNPAVVA
jgi:Ca-activated chloride channel family protein